MKTTLTTQTILLSALLGGILTMQAVGEAGADPYSKDKVNEVAPEFQSLPGSEEEELGEDVHDEPRFVSLAYEVFSLSLDQAAAYQREQIPDGELYKRLVAGLKAGGVKQENFTTIRALSGQKAKNQAISEHRHPTGYEKDSMPENFGLGLTPTPGKPNDAKDDAKGEDSVGARDLVADSSQLDAAALAASLKDLRTPALPVAFEVHNVGETLEIEPTLDDSARKNGDRECHLVFYSEQAVYVGNSNYGEGLNKTAMPEFEVRRIETAFIAITGKPCLVGTFNRPSHSKVDPDSANRVCYAFVTATVVRP